jgi:hypothetical protein
LELINIEYNIAILILIDTNLTASHS